MQKTRLRKLAEVPEDVAEGLRQPEKVTILTMRRVGELLPEKGTGHGGDRRSKSAASSSQRESLISHVQAHRYRTLATIPEDVLLAKLDGDWHTPGESFEAGRRRP